MIMQDEILDELDKCLGETVSLTVGRMVDNRIRAQHLPLDKGAADSFREHCRNTRERIASGTSIPYTATTEMVDDQFCVIDDVEMIDDLSNFRSLADQVATMQQIAPSDLDDKIGLYTIALGDDALEANRVLFVRKTNPRLPYKSGRLFAVLSERLTRIDEPAFSFSPDIDFVIGANWVIVLNQNRFETLFRAIGIVEQRVDTWISGITDYLPMRNTSIEALKGVALRDSRTWRRLRDIKQRKHLANVSLQQVREYSSTVGLDPDTVVVDGELVFDPAERFGFLHLLNEDLYKGPLTDETFESQRKAIMV